MPTHPATAIVRPDLPASLYQTFAFFEASVYLGPDLGLFRALQINIGQIIHTGHNHIAAILGHSQGIRGIYQRDYLLLITDINLKDAPARGSAWSRVQIKLLRAYMSKVGRLPGLQANRRGGGHTINQGT